MPVSERATKVGVASLVLGPVLMSTGDLLHPAENWAPDVQVAILSDSAWHWYLAHLLLLVGMFVFVPGTLEITRVAMNRRPALGYASRVLLIIGVGALAAVFVFEMLLGEILARGAEQGDAVRLLEAFQGPSVFFPLLPGLLAFFAGTGLSVVSLASPPGPFRWPVLVLGLGALLILAEIVSAQVLLSQIGNVLILAGGVGFARALAREQPLAA